MSRITKEQLLEKIFQDDFENLKDSLDDIISSLENACE